MANCFLKNNFSDKCRAILDGHDSWIFHKNLQSKRDNSVGKIMFYTNIAGNKIIGPFKFDVKKNAESSLAICF